MMDGQEDGGGNPNPGSPALSPEERLNLLFSPPKKDEDGRGDEPTEGQKAAKPKPAPNPVASAADDGGGDDEGKPDDSGKPVDQPPRYKVIVDGQEVEVELEELKKGYSFTSHNTRKAQKLAEERKEFEKERTEARELTKTYREILPKLEAAAQKAVDEFAGVDWDRLRKEDPEAFAEARAAHQLNQERLKAVQDEKAAEDKKAEAEQVKEFAQYVEQEQAMLLEKIPDWKDEAKRNEELKKVGEFAVKTLGFSVEDLQNTYDHRVIQGLRLAMLGQEFLANADGAKRKVSEAKKTAAPGGRKQESDDSGNEKLRLARGRLKKSGREQDAAEALSLLFSKKP